MKLKWKVLNPMGVTSVFAYAPIDDATTLQIVGYGDPLRQTFRSDPPRYSLYTPLWQALDGRDIVALRDANNRQRTFDSVAAAMSACDEELG